LFLVAGFPRFAIGSQALVLEGRQQLEKRHPSYSGGSKLVPSSSAHHD
jgi:hypothetical protein